MPDADIYLPMWVGAQLEEEKVCPGYQKDNTGENISRKNRSFCELTALYWAWKNLDVDYIGQVHYRRHFSVQKKKNKDPWSRILTSGEAQKLCEKYDIILPRKRYYCIESLYSHYAHTHDAQHLEASRRIVAARHPESLEYFDAALKKRSGHMFNMYLMRKSLSDEYCEWLFDILFELEKQIDEKGLSPFQRRFYGRVSEILLNVWICQKREEQPELKTKTIGWISMEPVPWREKTNAFLRAKYLGEKYSKSF